MRLLDLWERTIPSLWHLHCKNDSGEWEIVGLFNFEDQEQERKVEFSKLGLSADAEMVAWEFWEPKLLGTFRESLTMKLPARSCRVVSLRRLTGVPQVIGTDMHILQGWH